ncbi:Intracellular protein transport protein USO1 [Candida tropicalis]
MEYLNNILGQSNQVQSVEEAIPTLCNRLQHATMSSDRRSAVLGLKSFSRQYRESVVEHGLRPLIATFKKDIDNPQIIKPLLETLLILFIRGESDEDQTRGWISQQSRLQNGKYPSPLLMEDVSLDQLSLWIADALIQDHDTLVQLIENLSEASDYHTKLYTIQLLESLTASRGSRTKETLLTIPTAMSTICSLLNDSNEPVRNEAILLLMALVNDNFNIQKLVAFENTFETLFDIIEEEGGIRGSILVQDCLTLITNLLQFNASNQKFFLETQCVPKLAGLLGEPIDETGDPELLDEDGFPIAPPPITNFCSTCIT